MSSLQGQVAVVTGASGGVGKAISLALARCGATLCLLGRKPEELGNVARLASAGAAPVFCYQTDLTRDDALPALAANLERDAGGADVLIHCAGVISIGPVETAPIADLDWQLATNLRTPYALTKALLPMLRARRGQIVFINSTAGLNAPAGSSQYAISKYGLRAFAESLRGEVSPAGVRVTTVYIGRTATPMQAALNEMEGRPYQPEKLIQPDDVAAVVVNALSLPRTAEVTSIQIRPGSRLE
jgi:NAD(P)-dependent dehydrogenase (short-subunit alcohol dehydrogenase family)